jgi:hypothetical protein
MGLKRVVGLESRKIIGQIVYLYLEEHPHKDRFSASISGIIKVEDRPSDKFYLLKLDEPASRALAHEYVLFHPEVLELKRGLFRKSPKPRSSPGKVSLEDFVLDRDPAYVMLHGRLYGFPKTKPLNQMVLAGYELFILARCTIV